jgi:hypothetical protein
MPGVNAPKLAGTPSDSASVAGTEPPTDASVPQVMDIVFVGSLSDVAVSVTEPEAAAPAALAM